MNPDLRTSGWIPLPFAYASDIDANVLAFRRFGTSKDDLTVDFSTANRAGLATRILDSCIVDLDAILPAGFFSGLSAGKRIETLLALANGGSSSALSFPFKCATCSQELEIELTIDEISAIQRDADLVETVDVAIGDRTAAFRKCSGGDQESWFDKSFVDEREAEVFILDSLALDRESATGIGPDEFQIIEDALDSADPLVNLSFRVECDACGEFNEYHLDLFETALGMLRVAQRRLVISVHKLALNYHWSEKEIFEVPHWRREEYLELIGAKR